MTKLLIRKAKQADIPVCARMSHIPEFSYLHIATDKQAERYLDVFRRKGIFLIAEQGNEIIGFACAEPMLHDFYWLDALMVRKGLRNKGIGTRLLKAMVAELKKRKMNGIYLVAPKLSKNATHSYTAWGFRKGNVCTEFYKRLV